MKNNRIGLKFQGFTLEQLTYKKDNQSLNYRELYRINDKVIKLEIESDSYEQQCYARASVLKNDNWNIIYSIPHSLMNTPSGEAYRTEFRKEVDKEAALKVFKKDIEQLKEYVYNLTYI